MDVHVRWLRRVLIPRLLVRIALELIVVAEILLVLLVVLDVGRALAISYALVGGQIVVVARIAAGLYTNPINLPFLNDYLDVDFDVTSGPLDPAEDDSRAAYLATRNMGPLAVVHADARGGHPRADVYRSQDELVLAAVSDNVDIPIFASRLDDGRVLVTTNHLIPPHIGLVVNHVRRRNADVLLDKHIDVLERLHELGVLPAPGGDDVVADVFIAEQIAWGGLGSFLGPFLAVGARWKPYLLHARIPPRQILERTLTARHDTGELRAALPAAEPEAAALPAATDPEPVETSLDELLEAVPPPVPGKSAA